MLASSHNSFFMLSAAGKFFNLAWECTIFTVTCLLFSSLITMANGAPGAATCACTPKCDYNYTYCADRGLNGPVSCSCTINCCYQTAPQNPCTEGTSCNAPSPLLTTEIINNYPGVCGNQFGNTVTCQSNSASMNSPAYFDCQNAVCTVCQTGYSGATCNGFVVFPFITPTSPTPDVPRTMWAIQPVSIAIRR